jgi:hypothetical protein
MPAPLAIPPTTHVTVDDGRLAPKAGRHDGGRGIAAIL